MDDFFLQTGYENTLALGPNSENLSIYYDGTNGYKFNGTVGINSADITASNGIIHIVDTVVDLPTLATFATLDPSLTSLVEALQYADTGEPTVPYITTLSNSEAGPYTVFAPNNDAFFVLLFQLEAESLTSIAVETIDAALTFHIVSGNIQSNELMSGTVMTLGGEITANADDFTLTDQNQRTSEIVQTSVDIQSINGVIHIIDDSVLLPPLPSRVAGPKAGLLWPSIVRSSRPGFRSPLNATYLWIP